MLEQAGVVAMQGDVLEHARAIQQAFGTAVDVTSIRSPEELDDCDLVVLPGGESTTISRLISEHDLDQALRAHVDARKPLLATCAGLILVSKDADDDRITPLDVLDIQVDRNAYGSQRESFEAPIDVVGLDDAFPGVFIRAPRITNCGDVEVLATFQGEPVAVRDGSVVAASFHPELTGDPRFHRRVLSIANQ